MYKYMVENGARQAPCVRPRVLGPGTGVVDKNEELNSGKWHTVLCRLMRHRLEEKVN